MYRLKPLVFKCIGILLIFLASSRLLVAQKKPVYLNSSLPLEQRVVDLLQRLTLQEKIALLLYNSPGVPRLNIPPYNWWNEALHGVARAGKATVFPQAIGLAATFDDALIQQCAAAIGDEARAKFNAAIKINNRAQYLGLTFWSPNINIFRDPRWGRGHETYGEDPFLTGHIGSAFVKGLQGNNSRYYKAVACAKHFAVHSGPEPLRHAFNAEVSDNDLYNTYLPAFKELVTEAKVGGIMCAYNRTDSLPCCSSKFLLQDILRKDWGFTGYVVTDCWALDDIFRYHHFTKTAEEAAALALKAGVNVECGNTFTSLQKALEENLITPDDINNSLKKNLTVLFKLGFFDKASLNPYSHLNEAIVNTKAHQLLSRQAAAKSLVLLSNKNHTLPLATTLKNILITGPNADETNVLLANYNGLSGNLVTILEGITNTVSPSTIITHNKGCHLTDTTYQDVSWMINEAEAVVAVLGLSPLLEGENGDAYLSEAGGDKKDIRFPYAQLKYLKALREKTKKPLIVVVTAGSAVELKQIEEIADAVVLAWYPGEQGGNAVANVLFGKVNPSGRLPVTFYQSNDDLPAFENYSMQGRTYRYFKGPVTHPFGFGLSYTNFAYSGLKFSTLNNRYTFQFKLTNTGKREGEEVVQLYIERKERSEKEPLKQLKGYKRIHLKAGESKTISLTVTAEQLQYWDEVSGHYLLYPGTYKFSIGSSSADERLVYERRVTK